MKTLPAVNVLRLIRVFKMVRLFRKLTALRILINALSSSIVPVLYSFTILILVTSLYAIISTEMFASKDFDNFGMCMCARVRVCVLRRALRLSFLSSLLARCLSLFSATAMEGGTANYQPLALAEGAFSWVGWQGTSRVHCSRSSKCRRATAGRRASRGGLWTWKSRNPPRA